ncbi:unnamed protein product [Didymodactylos carnosus]|uniref:Uncharacterized protein n=1 Tax=Didymodactylos carnosus TaxID=1234261 RepID=A0A814WJF5_9BILA|nr:unnamed protein product [Didymodactylos carnosus]CAF3967541.1 unnamed protein product [Didymodactylos carnosus]
MYRMAEDIARLQRVIRALFDLKLINGTLTALQELDRSEKLKEHFKYTTQILAMKGKSCLDAQNNDLAAVGFRYHVVLNL